MPFAAAITFLTVQLASPRFGAEEGAAAGAFVLGICGNASARWRDRPAAIVVVPGLLLLVPGSLGFRGLHALMQQESVVGINLMTDMLTTGAVLAVGLLLADNIMPLLLRQASRLR